VKEIKSENDAEEDESETMEEEEMEMIQEEEERIRKEEEEIDKEKDYEEPMMEDQIQDQNDKDGIENDRDVPAPRYDLDMIADIEASDNGYLAMRSDSFQDDDSSAISGPNEIKTRVNGVEDLKANERSTLRTADEKVKSNSQRQKTEHKSAKREGLESGGEEGRQKEKERYFLRNRGTSVGWRMGPIFLCLALNRLL